MVLTLPLQDLDRRMSLSFVRPVRFGIVATAHGPGDNGVVSDCLTLDLNAHAHSLTEPWRCGIDDDLQTGTQVVPILSRLSRCSKALAIDAERRPQTTRG